MLGTSINLISLTGCMNPTDPPSVGSLGIHLTQVPQFSVMPYPREGVTNSYGRGMKGKPTLNDSAGEDNTQEVQNLRTQRS